VGCGIVILIIMIALVWICLLSVFMDEYGLKLTHQEKLLLSAVILLVFLSGKKIKRGLGGRGRN
jgi:hypothetical protein